MILMGNVWLTLVLNPISNPHHQREVLWPFRHFLCIILSFVDAFDCPQVWGSNGTFGISKWDLENKQIVWMGFWSCPKNMVLVIESWGGDAMLARSWNSMCTTSRGTPLHYKLILHQMPSNVTIELCTLSKSLIATHVEHWSFVTFNHWFLFLFLNQFRVMFIVFLFKCKVVHFICVGIDQHLSEFGHSFLP